MSNPATGLVRTTADRMAVFLTTLAWDSPILVS
jgi:hypothetical protein